MIKGRCLVGLIFSVVLISLNIDKSHGVFINHYILGSILIFTKAYEYVCIKKVIGFIFKYSFSKTLLTLNFFSCERTHCLDLDLNGQKARRNF